MNHEVNGGIGYGCKVLIDLYYFGVQQVLNRICIEYALDYGSGGGVVLKWRQNLSAAAAKTQDCKTKNQCMDDVLCKGQLGHSSGAFGDILGDMILYADQKEIW